MTKRSADKFGTMSAVTLTGTAKNPGVEVTRVSKPLEQPGRLVIEVVAAGITKMEPHWITGWKLPDGTQRTEPVVLGCEFAGRVRSQSLKSSGFHDGQPVLGMTEPYQKGAMAEYVSAQAGHIVPMPEGLSFEEASTLPLAGLTAWQALTRFGALQREQRVLIHGGAGGVGTFAVQIARWIGASTVVTASAGDAELCRQLGADEVIDFAHQHFEDYGRDYDVVFDQIGGDVQERSWSVLKPGGTLVTIAGETTDAPSQERARALGVSAHHFIVERNAEELRLLTGLVTTGAVRPVVGKRFPLAKATEAFDDRAGHFSGKAVLMCANGEK